MNNLILITGEFPFGKDEPFLESEIKYLAQSFDKIFIIANYPDGRMTREIPANCKAFQYTQKPSKADTFHGLVNKRVIRELSSLSKWYNLKLSPLIVKTALNSHANALVFRNYLSAFLQREKIEAKDSVIYSYWLNDLALGATLLKEKFPKTKIISKAHGWDVYFERHVSNYLPYRKLLAENIDAIFFVSENGKDYFQNKTGCPIEKLMVSRLGIINSIQPDLNRVPEKFTMVSCSYMIPLKRIHLIIEALSLMEIKVKWIHVGFGPMEQELRSLAKSKLANQPNVHFEFTGEMNNRELLNFYKNNPVSVFINVSEFEGIPVSMMEAMSFGIPVIATDVGGVGEIVKDGMNGVLLNKKITAVELAEVISSFSRMEKDKMKTYRSAAYWTWSEEYNAEKNYPAFVKQILKITGSN